MGVAAYPAMASARRLGVVWARAGWRLGADAMESRLDALRARIAQAGDAGLALTKMGGGKTKARESELRDLLAALARDGSIRGPFKSGKSQVYFSAGSGPTVDTVCDLVERLVRDAGARPPSRKALEGKMKGLDKRYFPDALRQATTRRAVLEIVCGSSKYYLHRDVAAERFGFEAQVPPGAGERSPAERELGFAEFAAVYRRLRAEQGGFTAVKIFDLVKALNAPTEQVHRLIATQAKAGRLTLHPSDSVNLPREEMEAALRLPGQAEAFVTVAMREDR